MIMITVIHLEQPLANVIVFGKNNFGHIGSFRNFFWKELFGLMKGFVNNFLHLRLFINPWQVFPEFFY